MIDTATKASVIDRGELDFEDYGAEPGAAQAADHVATHRSLRPYLVKLAVALGAAFLFGAYGLRPLLQAFNLNWVLKWL
jgi:hypothetical protein